MGIEHVAVGGFFITVIASIWLLSYFGNKKNTLVHETIRHTVEKGQAMPEETLQKLGDLVNPSGTDLRRGILFVAFSLAIMILALITNDGDADVVRGLFGISMFPFLLGAGYLGLWFFGRNKTGL